MIMKMHRFDWVRKILWLDRIKNVEDTKTAKSYAIFLLKQTKKNLFSWKRNLTFSKSLIYFLFFLPLKLNEEFWQYNTFQYWRNPLPPIDLADIEAINEGNLTEARLQSKDEVVEIDMESWQRNWSSGFFWIWENISKWLTYS